MSGTIFKKKLSFKDDNDNDNDVKVRTAHPGPKLWRAKNDDKLAFAIVVAIAGTSWSCTRGPLALLESFETCASWDAGVRDDDGSLASPATSHGEMRM